MSITPRSEDFENVRTQLRIIDRVYERLEARCQAIDDRPGADSMARRRQLMRELIEWVDASEELGEFVHAAARPHVMPIGAPLPPGTWMG